MFCAVDFLFILHAVVFFLSRLTPENSEGTLEAKVGQVQGVLD